MRKGDMVDKNDWRLNGQEEYLFGETLYFRKWDMSNINSANLKF